MLSLPSSDPVQLLRFDCIMFRKPSLVILPKVEDLERFALSSVKVVERGRKTPSDMKELTDGVLAMRVAIVTLPISSSLSSL